MGEIKFKSTKIGKDVLIYAFRYAVQRSSYALKEVIDEIVLNKAEFQKWELKQMISDINFSRRQGILELDTENIKQTLLKLMEEANE